MHRSRLRSLGFTLIEVVVGLVLLATLLVALLLAAARGRRLAELAENRQAAVSIADELLAKWVDSPTGIPIGNNGRIDGRPGWSWRTSVRAHRAVFGIPTSIIRVDIVRTERAKPTRIVLSVETAVNVPNQGGQG